MTEYVYKSITGYPIIVDNYIITPQPGLQSKYQIEVLDALIGSAVSRYDDGVLATLDNEVTITGSMINNVPYATINGTAIPLAEVVQSISTNTTISSTDDGKTFECTTDLIITIPAGLSPRPQIVIKPPPSGTVTITPTGGAQINGATSVVTATRISSPAGVLVSPFPEYDGYGISAGSGSGTNATDRTVLVSSYAEIQPAHDALVAAGGGTIHCLPNLEFMWPSDAVQINIDSYLVGISFNRSTHNLTNVPAGTVAFNVTSSNVGVYTPFMMREFTDGRFYSSTGGASNTTGVTAFKFDTLGDGQSNRVQLHRLKIKGLLKGITFGSRSYFVRAYDCSITSCRHALYQEAFPEDFAEKNTFTNCTFAGNHSHLTDSNGQIWTFNFCSFDHHLGYIYNLAGGSKVYANSCHYEWNYGQNPGETLVPFTLTGANTSVFIDGAGGTMAYTGTGQKPYYPCTLAVDNTSQKFIAKLDRVYLMGVLSDPNGLDTFALCSTSSYPLVQLRCLSDGVSVNDMPTMTMLSETLGTCGQLRNGIGFPINEISHRTGLTGTAAIASVSVDENGVTRKNAQPMVKITGQGTVLINFPHQEAFRRHAWMFFTNQAYLTGSVTIKERTTGFAPKFNGTTVVWTPDVRGAQYAPTTVTLAPGTDVWTRCSWKHCAVTPLPSTVQNMGEVISIEIDTTLMTSGALYLSYFGFDLI